jgi:hypothetical protein
MAGRGQRPPPQRRPPLDLRLGDRVRLKKPHPCGGDTWEVTRLGADIGLRCLTCGRRVLLDRVVLERRHRGPIIRPPVP